MSLSSLGFHSLDFTQLIMDLNFLTSELLRSNPLNKKFEDTIRNLNLNQQKEKEKI